MPQRQRPSYEQVRLIRECRQSGMTIADWCRMKGIRVDTFYSWNFRMKKKGLIDSAATIPQPFFQDPVRPDIVKINRLSPESIPCAEQYDPVAPIGMAICEPVISSAMLPVMEVAVGNVMLKVTNQVNPQLLAEMIRLLGGGSGC